jgi:hypothetical protein
MNENLKIYNEVRQVPQEAQKQIFGGRLKGMTDINPMWRIKKLTEVFGTVGFGWYYEITNKEILEGANDEKIAVVDISLYVKQGDEWSKPIQGTGGSSFVAKEKNGLYTSDEAFKMGLTDAISVACKALGIGADVYWQKDKGETKYQSSQPKEIPTTPNLPITKEKSSEEGIITKEEAKKLFDISNNNMELVKKALMKKSYTNTTNILKKDYAEIYKYIEINAK